MEKGVYTLHLTVNGQAHSIPVEAHTTLLQVLRDELGITSPKVGCNMGDCGACVVLVDGRLLNACITNALTTRGKHVLTLEGLGGAGEPHPLQVAFHQHAAAQCGFCTPGMILAAKALLDQHPEPSRQQIVAALSGNLCRCTGYVKIVAAIQAAAEKIAVSKNPNRERE